MSASRVVVLTGASDGIGAAAARALAARGHEVVVVGRSPERTARIADEIGAASHLVDLTHLSAVRELASALAEQHPRIDVLAHNAGGVFGRRRTVTADGHETTLQVNYLAPFLLTQLLLQRLRESSATVVSTASAGHVIGRIRLDDLDSARRYHPLRAYGSAKLAQILFTRELHRRYGDELSSAAFHPGNVATNFSSEQGSALRWMFRNPLSRRVMRSPAEGADTLVHLATARPDVDFPSGEYFADRRVARGSPRSRDPEMARDLWDRSLQILERQLR